MLGNRQRHDQRGFSLIEVVVAAALFSLGLGSMSLLLLLAVQGTQSPRAETLATLYAQSLADALRLVPDSDAADASEPTACAPSAACPPSSMAVSIMESWQVQIERDLPTGRGLVCRDSAPEPTECANADTGTITVNWREVEPATGLETTRKFTLAQPLP